MGAGGEETGHEVERQIKKVAKSVFDVVPEYEQHPQIGEKVSDAAVEEDRGEDGKPDVLVGEGRAVALRTRRFLEDLSG